MALLEIQLRHRLGHHRFHPGQRRDVRGSFVVCKGDRGRRRWRRPRRGRLCDRRWGRGRRRFRTQRQFDILRHDQRQIHLRHFLLGGLVDREHPGSFVLRAGEALERRRLRFELDVFLDLQPLGLRGRVSTRVEVHRAVEHLEVRRRLPRGRQRRDLGTRGPLDFELRLAHRLPRRLGHRGGLEIYEGRLGRRGGHRHRGLRRQRGRLALGAGQRLRGVPVHRVDGEQLTEPVDRYVQPIGTAGNVGENLQRQHVLGIQAQHLAEHRFGSRVVLLLEQAAPVHDVGADIVGVKLQPLAAQVDSKVNLARLAIGVRQWGEVAPLRILVVAVLEFLDFAGVRHGLSLCGNWTKIVFGRRRCQIGRGRRRLRLIVVAYTLMPLPSGYDGVPRP